MYSLWFIFSSFSANSNSPTRSDGSYESASALVSLLPELFCGPLS